MTCFLPGNKQHHEQETQLPSQTVGSIAQQMGTLLSSPLKENTGSVSAAKRLREHFGEVIDQLQAPYFVDELYAKAVISEEDNQMLKSLKGKRLEQAMKFREIMQTKGDKEMETFLHVLKATPEDKQPPLYRIPDAEQHERGSTTQTGTPERTDLCTATVDEGKQTLDMEVTGEQLEEVRTAVSYSIYTCEAVLA